MNFIELADIAWKLRKKDFYASAIKHLGIGLSVGWLVSTQISKQAIFCLYEQAYNCLIHISSCIIIVQQDDLRNEDNMKN